MEIDDSHEADAANHRREIAFSYEQIEEFLTTVALPHYEAIKVLPFHSPLFRCFGVGFYFFVRGVKEELHPAMAEELLNLAVRVEAHKRDQYPSNELWNQNALTARDMLNRYFNVPI